MTHLQVNVPPLHFLVASVLIAILGVHGLIEYRLLAPRAAESESLREDIRLLRTHPPTWSAIHSPPLGTATDELEGVLSHLSDHVSNRMRVERMHRIATEHGVAMQKGNYRIAGQGHAIGRLEIQAELVGPYPAVRQFLRELQKHDEAAAIQLIEFYRRPASTGVLAQVHAVLFFSRNNRVFLK